MTTAFRVRLAFLVGGMAVVAGLMLWNVQDSWHLFRELEDRLTSSRLASLHIADDFQQRLLTLNSSMVRFAARREPAMWTNFEQASAELNRWVDEQSPKLSTPDERVVFQQINAVYDDYLAAAYRVQTNRQPAMVSEADLSQLGDFDMRARQLLQLGNRFSAAQATAEQEFVTTANEQFRRLRAFFVARFIILITLVIGLGWVLYRDQIAPLRAKLVRNQALLEKQAKLASLGTLAAGIAHEIRNPLTSIKARLWTLDKHLDAPALARKDAEIIGAEITRLEGIVQDVLHFARPSEPELTVISAQELLREVHSLMASTLENDPLRFTLEPGLDLFISADVAHLKQVLINLVRNAAEAIKGAGAITLRARSGRATLNGRDTETVVLEVVDTGRGIPSEVEEHLFDPFFSTKETGTGLGLSIAARIVEKHGGNLQYQSSVGHGTTFGIVLPQAISPPQSPTAPTAHAPA